MNQHSFSKSPYTFSRVDLLEKNTFPSCSPLNLTVFFSVFSSFPPFKHMKKIKIKIRTVDNILI